MDPHGTAESTAAQASRVHLPGAGQPEALGGDDQAPQEERYHSAIAGLTAMTKSRKAEVPAVPIPSLPTSLPSPASLTAMAASGAMSCGVPLYPSGPMYYAPPSTGQAPAPGPPRKKRGTPKGPQGGNTAGVIIPPSKHGFGKGITVCKRCNDCLHNIIHTKGAQTASDVIRHSYKKKENMKCILSIFPEYRRDEFVKGLGIREKPTWRRGGSGSLIKKSTLTLICGHNPESVPTKNIVLPWWGHSAWLKRFLGETDPIADIMPEGYVEREGDGVPTPEAAAETREREIV